jgi:hypothetical protein
MNAMLDQRLHDEVNQALEPGEKLLWAGRPEPFRLARMKIAQMLIGALFLLLFFLVYRSSLSAPGAWGNATSRSFTLRSVILMSGGVLTLYSVPLPVLAYRKAKRTVYVATDRRVISLNRRRPVLTLRYDDMQQLPILNLNRHGSGDIWFFRQFGADAAEHRIWSRFILGIQEAEQVHRLVLGRMTEGADGRTAYRVVPDYLDLLLQGKRTLDDEPSC